MQLTIDDYLDMACKRHGLDSDRQLAKHLSRSHSVICMYRTGRSHPSDDVMVDIANMAKMDPAEALLNLHLWKAERDDTRQVISGMLAKLRGAAAAAVIGTVLTAFALLDPQAASAGTKLEQTAPAATSDVYYGKLRRWIRGAFEAVARIFAPGRALAFQA